MAGTRQSNTYRIRFAPRIPIPLDVLPRPAPVFNTPLPAIVGRPDGSGFEPCGNRVAGEENRGIVMTFELLPLRTVWESLYD
jgi:hypothetical protein